MTFAADVLAHSPLAYWRLGDALGSTSAADSSGNSRPLTTVAGTTFGATGLADDADTAATFGGFSQQNDTGASASWANLSTLTLIGLFATTATAGTHSIIDRDDEVTRQLQFRINSSNKLEFIGFSGGTPNFLASTATVTDGGRHLGAVVINGSSIKLYLDSGTPVATGTMGGNLDTGGTTTIGAGYHIAGSGQQGFVGTLDELAIIGSALTDTDIAALWTDLAGASPSTTPRRRPLVRCQAVARAAM